MMFLNPWRGFISLRRDLFNPRRGLNKRKGKVNFHQVKRGVSYTRARIKIWYALVAGGSDELNRSFC